MKHGSAKKTIWSVLTGLLCLLLTVCIIGSQIAYAYSGLINNALQTSDSVVVETNPGTTEDTQYFKSDYSSYTELRAHEEELSAQIQEEGTVLLKNNGVLPLARGAKVTLLSQSTVNVVYGGTGAGAVDASTAPTMMTALTAGGFQVNPTVWDFYKARHDGGYARVIGRQFDADTVWKLNETPVSEFTPAVLDSMKEYNDAAIVMISRSGGEGIDLPSGEFGDGNAYLALQDVEKDLLRFAKANFDKVIVVLNIQNPIEMDFVDAPEFGVDAVLWVGPVGQSGLYALAEILTGDMVPSGRLVDTFAYDSNSSPAMQNFGRHYFADMDEKLVSQFVDRGDGNTPRDSIWKVAGPYVVYAENIYVGYRYYETRYEDTVLGVNNSDSTTGAFASKGGWDYAQEVKYPFGYGTSYTTFKQTLNRVRAVDDHFELNVTVTNTGDTYASKDVVQVYAQSEYTDYDRQNRIEKASVELVGFAKTKLLAPGESQTLTVNVDKKDLATYDEYGAKTYIMDEGKYYLAIGADAHDAINNILAHKGYTVDDGMTADGDARKVYTWKESMDTQTYAVSSNGYAITNQMDKSELADYGYDVTTLTRADWKTFPQTLELQLTDELAHDILWSDGDFYEPQNGTDTSSITTGADTNRMLITLRGADYEDKAWDELLNQMTVEEMTHLIGDGGYGNIAIDSIGKPGATDADGSAGFSARSYGDTKMVAYQAAVVLASTWNTELLYETGKCIGEDGLTVGISGWYAPSINIHRTPYSGRNYEYFSEDAFLTGKLAAVEVQGAQEKGLYAYIKHFALNDVETERHGVATFASEQTIREVYLPAFQYCVEDGDAHGVMGSFNRIGGIWAGAHRGLLTEILRNEWGFQGAVVTDAANSIYMDVANGVLAGSDLWLSIRMDSAANLAIRNPAHDYALLSAMREACHRILYMVVNSSAMNGISSTMVTVSHLPWWKGALIAADIALGILFAGSLAMLVYTTDQSIRRKQKGGI